MNKKDLNLPGFSEDTLLVSIRILQTKIIDKEHFEFIKNWLQHNWVKLDELDNNTPIYAKPCSRFDYKYMMSNSQENVDHLLKKSFDAYKISNETYSADKKK